MRPERPAENTLERQILDVAPDPVREMTEVTSLLRTIAAEIRAPDGLRARRGALIAAAAEVQDARVSRRFGIGGWGRARAVAVAAALTLLTAVGVGAATLADRWRGAEPVDDRPVMPLTLPEADGSPDDGTPDELAPTPKAASVEPAEHDDDDGVDEPEDVEGAEDADDGADASDEPEDVEGAEGAEGPEDGAAASDEPEDAEDGAHAPDALHQSEEESSADASDDDGD